MDAALKIRRPSPSGYIGSEDVGFFEDDYDMSWANRLRHCLRIVPPEKVDPVWTNQPPAIFVHTTDLRDHIKGYPAHVFHTFQNADPITLQQQVMGFVHTTDISASNKGYAAHVFDAIQTLCVSQNRPRDRQIADRLINLHRDVLAEGDQILTGSLAQFVRFFIDHPDLALPKITMTPDGTLRARWISGQNFFVAIEFTGRLLVKLVAEIPRAEGQTATYFVTEMLANVVPFSLALGASFG